MTSPSHKKNILSEWLEKLQQESWQLELLISGFAILGLFEAKPIIEDLLMTTKEMISVNQMYIALMFCLLALYAGWYVFVVNLICHVLVRGLWIGAIGLRYVSGDIDYETLKYNDRFTRFYQRKVGSFDTYIENLEKMASVIFSYTFLIFFILFSFFIYISLMTFFLMSLVYLFEGSSDTGDGRLVIKTNKLPLQIFILVFIITQVFGGLLVLFDFVTSGLLKRIRKPWFAGPYFWIFRFFAFVTISRLWRPLMLNFLDQKYTRRLFFLVIPYAIVIGVMFPESEFVKDTFYPHLDHRGHAYSELIDQYSFNFRHYDEERRRFVETNRKGEKGEEGEKITYMSIPAKIIRRPTLEIFLASRASDKNLLTDLDSTLVPLYQEGWIDGVFRNQYEFVSDAELELLNQHQEELNEWNQQRPAEDSLALIQWSEKKRDLVKTFEQDKKRRYERNLRAIKEALQSTMVLSIDQQVIPDSLLSFDFYQHPGTKQLGLLCLSHIGDLRMGRHELQLQRLTADLSQGKLVGIDTVELSIPFYYEGD